MTITPDQIQQVAQLARLDLDAARVPTYAQQLTNILDMVGQLSSARTEDVLPMAHPLDMQQRLRPDVVTEPNRRETYQAHAPAVQDGLYRVPRVIE